MQQFTLFSAIILVGVSVVEASPFIPAVQPRAATEIAGYNYVGCFTEATNQRALSGSAFFDDWLTIQKCAIACSDFEYFGVEYGRECFCGNTLNEGSVEAPKASDCSFTCLGDPSQTCGAGNRLNVYHKVQSPPVTNPPVPTTYVSRGCYAEPESGGRALTGKEVRADDMTVQKCADICQAAGYSLFGLEYYTECFCGNVIMPGGKKADESGCRFPCAGDQTQVCGGDWRLNLYEFGAISDSPAGPSSSSSSTASLPPAATASALPYTIEGCYTEAHGKRALSEVSYYDDALTIARCATVCSSYDLFGVEYGRECYCGDTLNHGSEPAPITDCNMPCAGKGTETCGGPNRLNLYRNSPSVTTTTTLSASSLTPLSSSTSSTHTTFSTSSSSTTTSYTTSSTPSTSTPSTSSSLSTSTTSTSSSSSTSTTTTSSTTTTTAAPTPTGPINLITAGNFEPSTNPLTNWNLLTPAYPQRTTFNLQDTNSQTGQYSASFTWLEGTPVNTFSHWAVHKLDPNKVVVGKAYVWRISVRANIDASAPYWCGFKFELINAATQVVASMNQVLGFNTWWMPVQGYPTQVMLPDLYFSVKTFCYGTTSAPAGGLTVYIDDMSFSPYN